MALAPADLKFNSDSDSSAPEGTRNVLWLTAGAIALLVVIAIVALLVVSREMSESRESHVRVERTREILESLQLVMSTLQDAETGERGYVITGKQEFLAPYYAAERSLPAQLEQLEQLTGDPETQTLRDELARRAREQVAFLGQVVQVRTDAGAAAAAELINMQTGRQRMDTIRSLVQKLRAHEQWQLSNRMASFQERSHRTEIIVRVAMSAAILDRSVP